MQAMLQTLNNM
jgi:hypothetical protein